MIFFKNLRASFISTYHKFLASIETLVLTEVLSPRPLIREQDYTLGVEYFALIQHEVSLTHPLAIATKIGPLGEHCLTSHISAIYG